MVLAAMDGKRMAGTLCGLPLDACVAPERELATVRVALAREGRAREGVWHVGGLGLKKDYEHTGLVRRLHRAMWERLEQKGATSVVGQSVSPDNGKTKWASHHWLRIQPMGWHVLKGATSERQIAGAQVRWLLLDTAKLTAKV